MPGVVLRCWHAVRYNRPAVIVKAQAAPPSSLARRLGPFDAAAIIISNVIGGGILFYSPGVARSVPNPVLFLATWIAGGALAFAGAMAYAELAVVRPRAGGEYVYLDAAFGRAAAFLTGWTSFVAGFSGAIASSAVIFVFYLGRFVPGAASSAPLFVVPLPLVPLTVSIQALIAIAVIVAMAAIHIRGVGPGRVVGNVLAALKVTSLVLFIAFGLLFGTGSTAHLSAAAGPVAATSWLLALVPVMFAYAGWNAASYVAEEIRDPARNLPRSLAIGTVSVVAIYLLLNVLYLYVLPIDELAAVRGSVLDVVADKLLGARAGDVMGIVSLVSLAASISAMTIAGPRVYYAMARDGVFLPSAAKVHPRFQTPAVSIGAQAIWSALLVLSGSADALIRYTGFAVILFSGVAVAGLFVLRSREPEAPRPFKAFGYPVAPAVFVAASALIVANAIYSDPRVSGAGILIILAGVPLYLVFARGASRTT
jgi:basic amino acid/polyamine antiporter, APA family